MTRTPKPSHITPEFSLGERRSGANSTEFSHDGAATAALFVNDDSREQNADTQITPDIDEVGRNITPLLEEFTSEVNGTVDPNRFVVTRDELRALAVRGYFAGYQTAQSNGGADGGV